MSAIAVIGPGPIGTALAVAWAAAGHDVVVGTRRGTDQGQGTGPRYASRAQAIAAAEVVVNALPGEVAVAELAAHREHLRGRVLLDLANRAPGRGDPTNSIAEQLQAALPDTAVVKALNTMLATVMTDPGALATAPTAFVAGDDDVAKAVVTGLMGDLGWDPAWVADVGGLSASRALESFIDLVPALYARHRGAPFALGVSA